jgi:cation:H+ antiporter
VGLAASAALFVAGAGRVARRLGVPGLIIGLTVVAFGTSAPEFAVPIDAALTEQANISVGKVVGSNVVNLGFILGGVALVRALPTLRDLVRRDCAMLLGTTVVVLVALLHLRVSRLDGLLLLALFGAYLVVLFRAGSERVRGRPTDASSAGWLDGRRAVGGLVGIVVAAHFLVQSAATLAGLAGVSDWVIGVTIVAAGTSLPEFATSMAAVRRGQTGLSAGNLVGSCIFNFLGVLGVAAVLRPLSVVGPAVDGTVWILGIATVATVLFCTSSVLSRLDGVVLVALTAATRVYDLLL